METITREEYFELKGRGGSKYRNVISDTKQLGSFHSKKEAKYVEDTELEKRAHLIKDYAVQVEFKCVVNEVLICKYIADVVKEHNDGTKEIIDVKGKKTYAFILKWKLMQALFGNSYTLTLA